MLRGPGSRRPAAPTLRDFWPRFLEGHVYANRLKPSTIAARESIGRAHLLPKLGSQRLDAITTEQVQQLKGSLQENAPKTVNNVLTVLTVVLKKAVEWDVIDHLPCHIRLLPTPRGSAAFYDFDEYEALLEGAKKIDRRTYLALLLGGEAGLRCGEIMALEWGDVDLQKAQICVERSDWNGNVTTTKGGRLRYVPMTARLAAALRAHRHLQGARVLYRDGGRPLTQKVVYDYVRSAARRARLPRAGVHMLRHILCSHLAMRGAPARAIQELAGHMDLTTTQRYMHLSPTATADAIRLLEAKVTPLTERSATT